MTRCVLYARISVTKEESVSVDRQLEAGRRLAELRGWEVVGEFIDDGVSATANRPEDRAGWAALLRTPEFDAAIVWKVDRLARRVLDFLHVDETLQKRGAALVAVEDPIDMTTPMGRAFATILAVFGEMEAAAIASRVTAARAHILASGRWPGGGVPYGLMPAPNPDGPGRVLVIDPDRRDWLRKIVAKAMTGETVNTITTWLTSQGAPLPRGAMERRRTDDTTWNRQTVIGILRNPSLAGMTPRNPGRKRGAKGAPDPGSVLRDDDGLPVVNAEIALMTVADWEAMVKSLDERAAPQARKLAERRRTSPLLSRVARCDDCGVYMCRGTNQQRPVLYCPRCRQTIGRTALDAYLIDRLLAERSEEPVGTLDVAEAWTRSGHDDMARRSVLVSQLDTLTIRRGLVGKYFDEDRVLLTWQTSARAAEAVAA